MSLISDALKKARQEAARQDAQRQRAPFAVGAAESPDRRNPLLPLLAGLGAGCLIAGLLLAVAWSSGWGPFSKPARQSEKVAAAAPASPPVTRGATEPAAAQSPALPAVATPAPHQTAAPTPPASIAETRPQPSAVTRPAAAEEPPAGRSASAPPASAPAEERAPAAPALPVPARPSPAAPPQGAAALVDGQTYAGEVPVPGGGTVKLNGIVFTQDQPVAMLDGRVMGPGEIIQGFTIAAIEAGRVKLQGYGTTVFVSPK